MRSVFILSSDPVATRVRLELLGTRISPNRWILRDPVGATAVTAELRTADANYLADWEPDDIDIFIGSADNPTIVELDISRHITRAQALTVLEQLLSGDDYCRDDYSPHRWTVAQVRAEQVRHGHRFLRSPLHRRVRRMRC